MKHLWRYVRLGLIALAFIATFQSRAEEPYPYDALQAMSSTDLLAMLATPLVFFPLSLLLLLGLQTLNPTTVRVWTRPTHSTNPFNLRDPLHFFHFGAYVMGSCGLGYLAAGQRFWISGVMCLSCFAGALVGVQIFPLVFKKKYVAQS